MKVGRYDLFIGLYQKNGHIRWIEKLFKFMREMDTSVA